MVEEPTGVRPTYTGPALEMGKTCINGPVVSVLRELFGSVIQPGMLILDYGAGRYARNADWLRERGVRVYAYDPFNETGGDGWELGSVSSQPPTGPFDVGFTCYVLNVIPEYEEEKIVTLLRSLCARSFHVTRNRDIYTMVKAALRSWESPVTSFFLSTFATAEDIQQFEAGTLLDSRVLDLAYFGVPTLKGFQRIPQLEATGRGRVLHKATGVKLYES